MSNEKLMEEFRDLVQICNGPFEHIVLKYLFRNNAEVLNDLQRIIPEQIWNERCV